MLNFNASRVKFWTDSASYDASTQSLVRGIGRDMDLNRIEAIIISGFEKHRSAVADLIVGIAKILDP
jgi:hypothetical protein